MLEDCGNYCRKEGDTARVTLESTAQRGTDQAAQMTALRLGCGPCSSFLGLGLKDNKLLSRFQSALHTGLNAGHPVSPERKNSGGWPERAN